MNFNKTCRTCLTETTDLKGLFSVQMINHENLTLSQLLSACTSLEISEADGLPQQVCLQCTHHVLSSFSFQQQCHKSDSTLRSFLSGDFPTQFIQLKPPDICTENSLAPSIRINNILSNSSLQTETVEDSLNDQEIVDTFDNEVGGFEEESLSKHVPIENRISDLLVSNYEDTEALVNKTACHKNYDIKLVSIDHKNTTKESDGKVCKTNQEIDILDLEIQQQEQKIDYQLSSDYLEETKSETKKKHDDDTTQPLFPCEDRGCVACFTTENDLKHHMKTHRRAHYCKPCNQIFSSASTLSRHVNSKHQKGKKVHLCSECGKGFGRSDDLKRHLRIHTGERPFRCEKCGKAFAQSFRLLEHMRAHSNEKNFICATCGKAFVRYTSLLGHTKTHSGIKSHECKECGKRLCGASSLAMHMKIHTGERNFVCTFCGKGFASRSNLTIHRRLHTGEKPYVCNTCGKGFPDQSRLNVHNRIHSGEKPYVCSYCSRGCVSSSQLKKHIRIHTGERPYECKMCEKSFCRSEDLKIHIKIHKGERNHICDVCQKGFYQATTLKVHMRIHTGERPYDCHICKVSFSQTGPFSIHMKTHGKGKVIMPEDTGVIEKEKIIQYL